MQLFVTFEVHHGKYVDLWLRMMSPPQMTFEPPPEIVLLKHEFPVYLLRPDNTRCVYQRPFRNGAQSFANGAQDHPANPRLIYAGGELPREQ